jgi:hypothetical protein
MSGEILAPYLVLCRLFARLQDVLCTCLMHSKEQLTLTSLGRSKESLLGDNYMDEIAKGLLVCHHKCNLINLLLKHDTLVWNIFEWKNLGIIGCQDLQL